MQKFRDVFEIIEDPEAVDICAEHMLDAISITEWTSRKPCGSRPPLSRTLS